MSSTPRLRMHGTPIPAPHRAGAFGVLLVVLATTGPARAQRCPPNVPDPPASPHRLLEQLTDERLGGRLWGSEGEWCAANVIARELAATGVGPAGSQGFFQKLATSGTPYPPRNVVGLLPGNDPELSGEAIVVGAHHDHIGTMDGVVHPGADDNASGVVALILAARTLTRGPPLGRSVVFVTFTGEEAWFRGSTHYLRNPAVPLERTRLMVNLDMVGRLRSGRLEVSDLGTLAEAPSTLERSRLPLVRVPTPELASDYLPFFRAGVPVLNVTTGAHPDHHRPSDRIGRIDVRGIVRVAQLTAGVVADVAEPAR